MSDFIQMAQYRSFFKDTFAVLAEHNIESELLRRCSQVGQVGTNASGAINDDVYLESETEIDRLVAYEDNAWATFSLRLVVSDHDRHLLDQRCSVGRTLVAKNGIDTTEIQPLPDNPNKTVLFIGTLSYYPNIDGACYFAENILPILWQQDPQVCFWMAGAEPPDRVLNLATDWRIRVIANPDDMTEVARQCCLTVVPLRVGSGTRIKILHSMALGLPIVSTSLGCEGLDVQDGTHLFVRDDPAEFAQATVQLLNDRTLRQKFRQQGRQLVEQHYDWNQIFQATTAEIIAEYRKWQVDRK